MTDIAGTLPAPSVNHGRDPVADGMEAVSKALLTTTLGSETFEFRPVFDARVIVAMQRGDINRALTLAFTGGAKDVDRILAMDEPVTADRLRELVDDWAKAAGGLPSGES